MAKPGTTGIRRIINAFGYSLLGLKAAFKHESAFRQEIAAFIIMFPLSFWVGQTAIERSLLIGSLFLVLIAELTNSAIEAIVDRVGDEPHELSGRAKDIGSAVVLLSIINSTLIWGLIIFDRWPIM
ncbi:diacylglycerol kinase [Kaarinaea lacus]